MFYRQTAPLAAFILRISLGVMYLTHALVLKVGTFGMAGTVQFFQSLGLPGWTAYATVIAEVLAGILLLLGVGSRYVALALTPVLVGALAVHWGNGWVFSAPNGGWEYPLYLIVLSVVQALLGDGAYALSGRSAIPARELRAASA
ncbi:MAG: DoxX family protein [Rhodospirillaceae bacterium]